MSDPLPMTPENIARLIDEAIPHYSRGMREIWSRTLSDAAARLAAPVIAEPKWPESAWAVFDEEKGFLTAYDSNVKPGLGETVIPCRVVPADAVVVGPELLGRVAKLLSKWCLGLRPSIEEMNVLLPEIDAVLRKEAAP